MNARLSRRGMTLLEVQIAASLSAVILLGAMMLTHQIDKAQQVSVIHTDALLQGGRLFDTLLTDLRYCQFQSVVQDSTSIKFQIPIENPATASVLDPTGQVQYGADGNVGWVKEYHLGMNDLDAETGVMIGDGSRVLAETADNVDYNGDGDKTDQFILCAMWMNVYNDEKEADGVTSKPWDQRLVKQVQLTPPCIITTFPGGGGDVSGDGASDVVFEKIDATKEVAIQLWWCARLSPKPEDFLLFRVLNSKISLCNQ